MKTPATMREPDVVCTPPNEEGSPAALGLHERLGLIALIDEGLRSSSPGSPVLPDLFSDLWQLVQTTVSGSKINRLRPEKTGNGFHVFEITAGSGESLGRLHMLFLKKPIPCYYLVYVEVAPPFRRKGLGRRILGYFREFLDDKSAVGILDNIIPTDDPTFDIYEKEAWEPILAVAGGELADPCDHYMMYIPRRLRNRDLREATIRLVHHLKRKRAAIDMRENELMVQRTIAEFKALHGSLHAYFEREIGDNRPTPIMCFMFTRFVTKLIGFRRRIVDLIGYTGGDSLEQLTLSPTLAALPAQSYAPEELAQPPFLLRGDADMWTGVPPELREQPARFIESLPNYRRPHLTAWLARSNRSPEDPLTLGDFMDLGFDPTRLKEFSLGGQPYIFERIQLRQLPELDEKANLFRELEPGLLSRRAKNAPIRINPPLLVIRDRGNAYVLRRKVEGIHWEEAIEQLQDSSGLRAISQALGLERLVTGTIRDLTNAIAELTPFAEPNPEQLAYFVSWDLAANRPRLVVDPTGNALETVWIA